MLWPRPVGTRKKTLHNDDVERLEQGDRVVELRKVVARDGGVDLHRQPDFARPRHRIQRPLVRALHAPESVVNLRRRAIERDRQPRQAALLSAARCFRASAAAWRWESARCGRCAPRHSAPVRRCRAASADRHRSARTRAPPCAAISSISRFASSVLSSSGLRAGCAQARQCTHARSQACVVSHIATNGRSSKLICNVHWLHALLRQNTTSMPDLVTPRCDLGHGGRNEIIHSKGRNAPADSTSHPEVRYVTARLCGLRTQ